MSMREGHAAEGVGDIYRHPAFIVFKPTYPKNIESSSCRRDRPAIADIFEFDPPWQ